MTEVELELTYLAKYLPKEIIGVKPKEIIDIMIPDKGVKHPQLRLRKKGAYYEICKKAPIVDTDFSIQNESTIELNKREYESLARCSKIMLCKDRYQVLINGIAAEVDVFKGDLSGLVIIDFEFNSLKDKQKFKPPDVCLCDVTQEEFIAGGLLAGKKYSDISEKLKKLGYKSIT